MTREEAIETLNGIHKWYHGISKELVIGEKQIEAFEMAIKALQTQLKESQEIFNKDSATESMLNADLISRQTEPCEDAISREKVLKVIETVCFSDKWREFRINNGSNGERDYIIKFIEQMPSVQPTACIAKISFDDQQMKEMIDKAISNLDFSDLISRQAAIDEIYAVKPGICYEDRLLALPSVQPELNCKSCVFRTGYGTGIDEGILNAFPKKMKEGE